MLKSLGKRAPCFLLGLKTERVFSRVCSVKWWSTIPFEEVSVHDLVEWRHPRDSAFLPAIVFSGQPVAAV